MDVGQKRVTVAREKSRAPRPLYPLYSTGAPKEATSTGKNQDPPRLWLVFEWMPDDEIWVVVSRRERFTNARDALKAMKTLVRKRNPPKLYRVVGFSSLDSVRDRVKNQELADQDGVSLHRSEGSFSPLVPSGWDLVFDLIRNGHVDVNRVFTGLGYTVHDKRSKKGHLWVEGDSRALEDLMFEIMAKTQLRFRFTPYGSRATGYEPAWYSQ